MKSVFLTICAILLSLTCYLFFGGLFSALYFFVEKWRSNLPDPLVEFVAQSLGAIVGVFIARYACDKLLTKYSLAAVFCAFAILVVFSVSVELYFADNDFQMVLRLILIFVLAGAAWKVFWKDRHRPYSF